MPHPLHSIQDLILSQKLFRSPHLKLYIFLFLWWKASNDTNWGYPGCMPNPYHLVKGHTSTVQIPTPKAYIFLFLMVRGTQWHQLGGPPGLCPTPPVHIRLNISETIQNPNPKPYIIVPYEKTYSVTLTRVPGLIAPPPSLHKMPTISETHSNPQL